MRSHEASGRSRWSSLGVVAGAVAGIISMTGLLLRYLEARNEGDETSAREYEKLFVLLFSLLALLVLLIVLSALVLIILATRMAIRVGRATKSPFSAFVLTGKFDGGLLDSLAGFPKVPSLLIVTADPTGILFYIPHFNGIEFFGKIDAMLIRSITGSSGFRFLSPRFIRLDLESSSSSIRLDIFGRYCVNATPVLIRERSVASAVLAAMKRSL